MCYLMKKIDIIKFKIVFKKGKKLKINHVFNLIKKSFDYKMFSWFIEYPFMKD